MPAWTHPTLGMGLYFFYHDDWERIFYKNCTMLSMPAHGNMPIGMLSITLGIFCELLYIPFMIVMAKQDFMSISAYKFMFLLGIIDMITLVCNTIIYGIQGTLGIHYCAYPHFFYIVGCTSVAGWFGATITCSLLALDRFFGFIFPSIGDIVFSKKMMKIWLTLIPIYYVYTWLNANPTTFNTKYMAAYYDPFFGTEYQGNVEFTDNGILLTNSAIIVPILGICYTAICIMLFLRTHVIKHVQVTKVQRIMLYQSICICWEIFIVATVYVASAIGLFTPPEWFLPFEHIAWELTHADTPIVYMIFNVTLRKAVMDYIKNFFVNAAKKPIRMVTSVYRPTRVDPFPYQTSQNDVINPSAP